MVLSFAIVCHESGCRVGELLTLRLKHVSFDQHRPAWNAAHRTGEDGDEEEGEGHSVRPPPLLASWMENHPWEDDHDAPLWIMIGVRNKHSNMSYAASMMLRRLARTCFAA